MFYWILKHIVVGPAVRVVFEDLLAEMEPNLAHVLSRKVRDGASITQIARELVAVMQRDVKTDWTVRADVRAKLRSSIKRLLVKHKYPPDKQPGAVKLVLERMELLASRLAER